MNLFQLSEKYQELAGVVVLGAHSYGHPITLQM